MSVRSELRTEAMERAGHMCEFPACNWTRSLEMAHLKGSGAGGSKYRDNLDNVTMLCKPHHEWLDGAPIIRMKRFDNEMVLRVALDRHWEGRR